MNYSPLHAFLLIPLVLVCLALSPQARATCKDGCDLINGNTFLGDDALVNNTATDNTAIGADALNSNATGIDNTATGSQALQSNTTGNGNTAVGRSALLSNQSGINNTMLGMSAGLSTHGSGNTGIGFLALLRNLEGSENIAIGDSAGANIRNGSNNIDIGNTGTFRDEHAIRIGTTGTHTRTFVAGIHGVTVADGVAVMIDNTGQLGTVTSSARYKEAIKPMAGASEAILALKPVTFCYKHELDPAGIPQFGLVAEDVEKVNPDLVARDEQGKPYTVRYEAVNAMLLNEFLKEHRKVEELEANAVRQQKQIEALTAGLQKVSTQLELRSAPQVANSNY